MLRPERHAAETSPVPAATAPIAVDFSRYIPTVLSRLVSRLRMSAQPFFQETYGISLFEWRVVSALAAEGAMTAYAIWTEGGLDKAAVSRALKSLRTRGILTIEDGARINGRRRTRVMLTAQGRELHARTLAEVIARHARLIEGIDRADLETMLRTLDRIERQITAMGDTGRIARSGFPITRPARAKD